MMHGTYLDAAGIERDCDLDALKVVARGVSLIRQGWSGLLAFYPATRAFIELRSSPPNIRGDSKDEATEVDDEYIERAYGLTKKALEEIRR